MSKNWKKKSHGDAGTKNGSDRLKNLWGLLRISLNLISLAFKSHDPHFLDKRNLFNV